MVMRARREGGVVLRWRMGWRRRGEVRVGRRDVRKDIFFVGGGGGGVMCGVRWRVVCKRWGSGCWVWMCVMKAESRRLREGLAR